jgi:hypothetical protein
MNPSTCRTITLLLPTSVNWSPLRRGFILVALTLFFGLLPAGLAVNPPPDGGYPNFNTAEGDNALFNNTNTGGDHNVALGESALFRNTTGSQNTATGSDALYNNTTGGNNTATGYVALVGNTTGSENVANGVSALNHNTTGSNNTATGYIALESNTTADNNTATGYAALGSNTTGSGNTATGVEALGSNTNGSDNTAIGFQALFKNGFDAIDNTAVGSGALFSNTSAGFNTAIGFHALFTNTASNNTAIGDQTLVSNTTGTQNTANGAGALFRNTTGNNNMAGGLDALFNNTTGSNNTADGPLVLENNTSGHDNSAEGFQALANNTTGSSNIALGSNAGINLTTGSNNIDIGAPGTAGESKRIRIGKQGTQIATFIAGIYNVNEGGTIKPLYINSNGQIGTQAPASARRFKKEIKPMDQTSEAILGLKPVTFQYKGDSAGIPQFGLIAEEVAKANPDLVVRDDRGDIYTVRYEAVNAMLLNEFLKEHRKVEEQQATIAQMNTRIETLAATVQEVSAQIALRESVK